MNRGKRFVSDSHPQSALREWRAHIGHPATLTALFGVAAVLGVAGPFGTDARLHLGLRVPYWLAVVGLTYGSGSLVDGLVRRRSAHLGFWVSVGLTSVIGGAAIALVVFVINLIAFGWLPRMAELAAFLGTTFAIAAIVTVVLAVVRRQSAPQDQARAPARILARLSLDKRGPLVALSVEDHYVRIQTTRGADLVLLRLSDAMNEVGDTPGAQVHRSHWAAFDQVTAARRLGDRAVLTMSTGAEIPVSRANVSTIKEAGLLP